MTEAVCQEVDNYVSCRQNTAAQFIATRPIMNLCMEADQMPGSRVSNKWWENDGLDLEGMQTADHEADRTEGEEDTDRTEADTD